ncbi:MAG: hypothetical protein J6Q54_08595, partial [Oscillospiraceae bacterium]|nr:hypothetical protein [Oscillospiraceae bacterium]
MAKNKKTLGTLPTSVEEAKENYETYVADTPGDFLFSKEELYRLAEEAIANRESFSYDPNADALYRQYRDSYARQGSLAMEDTLGVAAAMNGGYGSSYGITAGQQAYQGYLSQTADLSPELYRLAYQRYTDETGLLQERYDTLAREREAEYADHQAAWSQYHAGAKELYQ